MLLRSNGLVGNNSEALKVVWHVSICFYQTICTCLDRNLDSVV